VSAAEVAKIPFTAFSPRKKAERIPGRLVVRRIPELNPKAAQEPNMDHHRQQGRPHHRPKTTTPSKTGNQTDPTPGRWTKAKAVKFQ